MSKKRISILILVLLFVALVVMTFASCGKKDMSITASDATAVYDGQVHGVSVQSSLGDESGWTITYTDKKGNVVDAPVNAGEYTAKVTYSKKGYNDASATAVLKITKATPSVPSTAWPSVKPNAVDGLLSVTYGTAFSSEWLSTTRFESTGKEKEVSGTFSWRSGQTLSVNNKTYDVTFTPDNTN